MTLARLDSPDRASPREETSERSVEESVSISVIVPVCERPEPLGEVYREYSEAVRSVDDRFEFLFVLEPYHRSLADSLRAMEEDGGRIRILELGQSLGESTLLKVAASRVRGEVIVTLPAYRRVQPGALAELLGRLEAGADVAVARRWPRRDGSLNRIQTRIFNWLLSTLTGGDLRDIGCGVSAMRAEVLRQIPLYGDYFRFLPLLAQREGYVVEEVDTPQHPGDTHTRIYSPGVYLRRLIDLLGVFFLFRFTYKPLRFFGLVGSGLSLAGGAIMLVLFVQRLGGQALADRPLLVLGALLVTFGVQSVAIGLVGEIIVHLNASRRPGYRVRSRADE